jgi:purine-nucleoside phosphorylase
VGDAALDRLRQGNAEIAIVLGSGLNVLVAEADAQNSVSYSEFPELPKPSVPGHAGRFVLGKIGNTPVVFAQGRVHLYEGHAGRDVTAGVRVLASAGIKRLILTNAAGVANESFAPGRWMMITDHLNLTGTTPLLGTAKFLDLTETYSKAWRAKFKSAAESEGITLHEGVYAGLLGPQYETPAEVRMLRHLGADAVGMSTVPEAIVGRHMGMVVLGISCITNPAAGVLPAPLDHNEVMAVAAEASEHFIALLEGILGGL